MSDLLELHEVTDYHPLLPPYSFEDGEQGFRGEVVSILCNIAGLGMADDPPGRQKAYVDLLLFSAPPADIEAQRPRFAKCPKSGHNSSCGLTVRAVWRLLGSRSETLDPLRLLGSVMTDLQRFAAEVEAGEPVTDTELLQDYKGQVRYSELKKLEHLPPDPPAPPGPPPAPPPAGASEGERAAYLERQAAYLSAKRDFLHAHTVFLGRRQAYDTFLVALTKGKAAAPHYPPDPPHPAAPPVQPGELSLDAERVRYPQEVVWQRGAQRTFEDERKRRDRDDPLEELLRRKASKGAPLVRPDGEGFSREQLLDLDPRSGDVLLIFKMGTTRQHVFTLLDRQGDTFYSVDGGNPSRAGDGSCCGIKSVRRTLQDGYPALFAGEDRPVVAFIRYERLVDRLAFGDAPLTRVLLARDQTALVPLAPPAQFVMDEGTAE